MNISIEKLALSACLMAGLATGATAQVAPGFAEKLQSEDRPIEDRMRDDVRRPHQMMELLGVEEGMTVVDVAAGGGWYTRVLSAAVGPEGTVISHFGQRALEDDDGQAEQALADELGNVEPVFDELNTVEEGSADAAITALNLHDVYNFGGEGGAEAFIADIYGVLKPGGRAAVIDHEGSEGNDNAQLHRLEKNRARFFMEEAGFEIVEDSDLLRTYADDHTLPAHAPELGRHTDRFVLIGRKPE